MRGLVDEYAAIAEGMRNGTLRPRPPQPPMQLWTSQRFSATAPPDAGAENSFCEQFNSMKRSGASYSFGNCTLKDSLKVSVGRDMATAVSISPGPLTYTLKGTFGPHSAALVESDAPRPPVANFGTDLRASADIRELKVARPDARGLDEDVTMLRTHASTGFPSFG